MPKDDIVKQVIGWIFLAIIIISVFGYAILYHISVALFPWFVFFYIISGLGVLISIFLVWYNWDDDIESFMIVGGICLLVFFMSMAGASMTAGFINDIPKTQEGKASLEAWDSVWFVVGIPEYVQGELNRILEEQSKDICKQYDEQTCKATQNIISTYKDSQELKDWIDNGKTLYDFVKEKSNPS